MDDDGKQLLLLGFSPRYNSHQQDYDEIVIGDTFLKKSDTHTTQTTRSMHRHGKHRHGKRSSE